MFGRLVGLADDHLRAHQQHREHRHAGHVIERQHEQHDVVAREAHPLHVGLRAVDHGLLREHHALGQPRGAAGVQHEHRILRPHGDGFGKRRVRGGGKKPLVAVLRLHAPGKRALGRRPRRALGRRAHHTLGAFGRVVQQHQRQRTPHVFPKAGQTLLHLRRHDHHLRVRPLQQLHDHPRRQTHVVRLAHRAQPGAGERGLDERQGIGGDHGHVVARTHAQAHPGGRQPADALPHVFVRVRLPLEAHGNAFGPFPRRLFQYVREQHHSPPM